MSEIVDSRKSREVCEFDDYPFPTFATDLSEEERAKRQAEVRKKGEELRDEICKKYGYIYKK